jgi:SAM-dependent methyltransferase
VDRARISAITHGELALHDPLATATLDETLALLDVAPGDRALDVGCGPGEVLVRRAERTGAGGVGVDTSAAAIEAARRRARLRAPAADLRFVCADAAAVDEPGPFALAACVGASHALGGLGPALAALTRAVRPGGHVLLGDGFWRREPSAAYLEALGGATRDELPDLRGLVAAGTAAGLRPVSVRVSTDDDWDRYEWTLVANGERYAAAHPDEPGVDALLAWVERARARVLLPGGRETLGFALVLLLRP